MQTTKYDTREMLTNAPILHMLICAFNEPCGNHIQAQNP
jgi:hypothetical protein